MLRKRERPFLYYRGSHLALCSLQPFPPPRAMHTNKELTARKNRSLPVRCRLSRTLPVSTRGFASAGRQGDSRLETSPGWPEEEVSSSWKPSHRAAGICQDGCYLATQRDPCLPSSTVENKGKQGCSRQTCPLFMSLRMFQLASETRSLSDTFSKWHINTHEQRSALPCLTHTHT